MFDRFTPSARQVVIAAQQEARSLRHNYIGTEHFLLALCRRDVRAPAPKLAVALSSEVDYARVRERIVESTPAAEDDPAGHIPFTPRAKLVLELALRECHRLGEDRIRPGHLLLAVLAAPPGMAVTVLTALDVDLSAITEKVETLLRADDDTESDAEWPRTALAVRVDQLETEVRELAAQLAALRDQLERRS
jgi:ATP-dependent Clp protease ATP-binding subunit ClpC